jgi:hypothetical protein
MPEIAILNLVDRNGAGRATICPKTGNCLSFAGNTESLMHWKQPADTESDRIFSTPDFLYTKVFQMTQRPARNTL